VKRSGGLATLVVMARRPEPGKVKTRLARVVGDERACDLYRAFLRDLSTELRTAPWHIVWAVDPPASDLGPLIGTGQVQIDQSGTDLAERMQRCFATLFARGNGPIVMIGADAPHLGRRRIAAAFEVLGHHDVVLVPTADGGYCLIGLTRAADLFTGIAMGTPEVFAETQRRIAHLGLTGSILPETFDVDELADVARLETEIENGAVSLAHTAAVLREWRVRGLFPGTPPNAESRRPGTSTAQTVVKPS
jgi:rSAM/selenodomain-associated transferase 1